MKKFRFFIAVLVVLFLSFGNSNAQNKTTFTESYDWEGVMPCTDDYAWGIETLVATNWESKAQIRWKGSYEGESGKHNTWSLVVNNNWKNLVEGQSFTQTYVSTSVVECEGVPIALYKIRYHLTVNGNGDIAIERYSDSGDSWICQ